MSQTSQDMIQSIKKRIQETTWDYNDVDSGIVVRVGDGIAFARGLKNVLANELVRFDDGTEGLALNLEENQVGIIILGSDQAIKEGSKVYRTEEVVSVPVGDELLGRVVDSLGQAIDGGEPIQTSQEYFVERPAPDVMSRESVNDPLFTGIKVLDSIIPIGKGQRELIIGDRQTGKTSIAVNTILNQKETGVKCVYVAIGQKASTVAQVTETLRRYGALDYTVIVNSPADDSAALQYLAPYAGAAMAEYWMDQGEDTLIIYDDLSKHAVAYRTISLLLGRPSGREAYPGDVFYLHSRLLERAANLNSEHGGGSMTALPIIETQLGDISAYIPTNVISITDGQIFLNTEMFNAGRRPAVDVGLSVSRVGSAAQTPAMKQVSSSLKLELAQFEEMRSFSQFTSDIDAVTQGIIDHGERIVELLKQPAFSDKPHHLVIMSIYLAYNNWIDRVDLDQVADFEAYVHAQLTESYPELMDKLAKDYVIDDTLKEELEAALEKIYQEFSVM